MAVVTRVRGREEMLAAILDPLHRTLEAQSQQADDEILGIEVALDPEPSANVGRDHAHLVLGQA